MHYRDELQHPGGDGRSQCSVDLIASSPYPKHFHPHVNLVDQHDEITDGVKAVHSGTVKHDFNVDRRCQRSGLKHLLSMMKARR